MNASFIGIDWGTTHRRASVLDSQGRVLAQHHDGEGMLACAGRFAESLQTLLARWPQAAEDVPVVMSGMVGAASGWQEAPYLDHTTPLTQLAKHLVPVREAPGGRRWRIVPGVRWHGEGDRVDVMRGEETQLLGALQLLGPEAADGCYVLPGTHSKWVTLRDGAITSLRTYMSGELYARLSESGTLSAAMQAGPASEGAERAAFARGVADAGELALSQALFGVRARVVTGVLAPAAAAAQVSGLLIGTEWHDLRRWPGNEGTIRVIGDPALAERHARCATQLGRKVQILDVHAVQQAAWAALRVQGV